ncbi:MAG: hypothetical protein NT154_04085 [Verrucomicrobia bacterium]|nr:hypothetical protein [Verrucomicrobiota bacterium]
MKYGINNCRETCQLNGTQGHDRQGKAGFDELHHKTENGVSKHKLAEHASALSTGPAVLILEVVGA